MKQLLVALVIFTCFAGGMVGCGKKDTLPTGLAPSSPPDSPPDTPAPTRPGGTAAPFPTRPPMVIVPPVKLTLPDVTLKQGEEKEIKIKREGGDKAAVLDLKFTAPEKVTITGGKFAADKDETTLKVKAADDAPVGDAKAKVKVGDKEETLNIKIEAK